MNSVTEGQRVSYTGPILAARGSGTVVSPTGSGAWVNFDHPTLGLALCRLEDLESESETADHTAALQETGQP